MKVSLFLALATLMISANCQQFLTMENCLYDIGIVVADVSYYYKDRSNPQYLSKLRGDIVTLYRECLSVLPSTSSSAPMKCESILAGIEKLSTEQLVDVHNSYNACVSSQ